MPKRYPVERPSLRPKPLPPGTVLRVTKLWPGADPAVDAVGQVYLVGPYAQSSGLGLLWLFDAGGELATTADRPWVDEHFTVITLASSPDWYHFPEPWPPVGVSGSAA